MPPAIPSCQLSLSRVGTALAMTGKEVPTFPGVSRRFLGYPFPEAAMLGNLSKRETQTTYLVNFIRLLPILEYCVDCIEDAKDDMVLLYSNMWRNVLAGTEPDHKHGTIANAKRTAYLICFTELLENSGLPSSTVDLHHLHSIPANWCGVPLAEANTANADLDIIHTEVAREIIWFINEVNWRAEMLALDRFLYDAEQLHLDNDPQTPQERRVIVIQHMQHWGQTVVPPEDVIGQDVGFASLDLGERLTAAFNLIEVMSTWTLGGAWCVMPDKLKELDKEMRYRFIRDGEVPPVRLIDQFEEEMWAHYIHSFVHVFARAPSLPRAIRPGSLSA
ncbi:hypothetical protein CYLTODRAFT_210071 [Cylindrobasidium torrendii FP15055 ss-10]|uniref:Uncharacterized protein n=1 Tax=Cylindrobasidium torrendii FP15055 ss-10 TaxID=1314674 RepID=A0A0D7ATW5_9AGAR|nr:hypothetical protein CYLTODRAFT_210071 [Cylindrobasidium torrendii FP15055 ss-10]